MLISPSIYLLISSPWRLSNHLRSTHQGISGVILKIQHGGIPMWKYISLMMICCTANAAMYSCVDDGGKKVLRSSPCEENEKQQPIVIKADPSYYVINSTGEKQAVESYQPKQAPKSVAQSGAPKNLNGQAKTEKLRASVLCQSAPFSPGCPEMCRNSPYDPRCTAADSPLCQSAPFSPGCPEMCRNSPYDLRCTH